MRLLAASETPAGLHFPSLGLCVSLAEQLRRVGWKCQVPLD